MDQVHDKFKNSLLAMTTGIVWKNQTEANIRDSGSNPYLVDVFISANRGVLRYDFVRGFPEQVLRGAGVLEENILAYYTDKSLIPEGIQERVLEEYVYALTNINPITNRQEYPVVYSDGEFVTIYEEKNNYYRMLNGLPDYNDTDFIYSTFRNINPDTPIHLLSYSDRITLEIEGELDALYKANPTKEYIKYLGSKQIDIYASRSAARFDILYMPGTDASEDMKDAFKDAYKANSDLILYTYYSEAYKKKSALYENFLAMCILFMSLQSMLTSYVKVDTTRDFYDSESISYIYQSYGVPFHTDISLKYHQRIIKGINKLIAYKGTTNVFFDLFSLFDLTGVDIYSYYFIKYQKFVDGKLVYEPQVDILGNPIVDKNGRPLLQESSYDIKMAKVVLGTDPTKVIADPLNHVDIDDITYGDPFWLHDDDVTDVLVNSDFNYAQSKYIGIQTTFDLLKITYESAFMYKLILDNHEKTKLYYMDSHVGSQVSIFTMIMYLSALYTKRMPFEENITSQLPVTARILGYNFKDDITSFKEYSALDKYDSVGYLKAMINDINVNSISSIEDAFNNIVGIKDYIIERIHGATTMDEYHTFRNLYNTIITSELVEDVYKLPSGEIAPTFSELLKSLDTELYLRLQSVSSDEIVNEMSYAIGAIEAYIESINVIEHTTNGGSLTTLESLFKMLEFFKSAKAQLLGYNVIYHLSGRGMNFFKFIEEVEVWDRFSGNDYGIMMLDMAHHMTDDVITKIFSLNLISETILQTKNEVYLVDYLSKMLDEIFAIYSLTRISVEFSLKDELGIINEKTNSLIELQILKDKVQYIQTFNKLDSDKFYLLEKFMCLLEHVEISDYLTCYFVDILDVKSIKHNIEDYLLHRDQLLLKKAYFFLEDDFISFFETLTRYERMTFDPDMMLSDDGVETIEEMVNIAHLYLGIKDVMHKIQTFIKIDDERILLADSLESINDITFTEEMMKMYEGIKSIVDVSDLEFETDFYIVDKYIRSIARYLCKNDIFGLIDTISAKTRNEYNEYKFIADILISTMKNERYNITDYAKFTDVLKVVVGEILIDKDFMDYRDILSAFISEGTTDILSFKNESFVNSMLRIVDPQDMADISFKTMLMKESSTISGMYDKMLDLLHKLYANEKVEEFRDVCAMLDVVNDYTIKHQLVDVFAFAELFLEIPNMDEDDFDLYDKLLGLYRTSGSEIIMLEEMIRVTSLSKIVFENDEQDLSDGVHVARHIIGIIDKSYFYLIDSYSGIHKVFIPDNLKLEMDVHRIIDIVDPTPEFMEVFDAYKQTKYQGIINDPLMLDEYIYNKNLFNTYTQYIDYVDIMTLTAFILDIDDGYIYKDQLIYKDTMAFTVSFDLLIKMHEIFVKSHINDDILQMMTLFKLKEMILLQSNELVNGDKVDSIIDINSVHKHVLQFLDSIEYDITTILKDSHLYREVLTPLDIKMNESDPFDLSIDLYKKKIQSIISNDLNMIDRIQMFLEFELESAYNILSDGLVSDVSKLYSNDSINLSSYEELLNTSNEYMLTSINKLIDTLTMTTSQSDDEYISVIDIINDLYTKSQSSDKLKQNIITYRQKYQSASRVICTMKDMYCFEIKHLIESRINLTDTIIPIPLDVYLDSCIAMTMSEYYYNWLSIIKDDNIIKEKIVSSLCYDSEDMYYMDEVFSCINNSSKITHINTYKDFMFIKQEDNIIQIY